MKIIAEAFYKIVTLKDFYLFLQFLFFIKYSKGANRRKVIYFIIWRIISYMITIRCIYRKMNITIEAELDKVQGKKRRWKKLDKV